MTEIQVDLGITIADIKAQVGAATGAGDMSDSAGGVTTVGFGGAWVPAEPAAAIANSTGDSNAPPAGTLALLTARAAAAAAPASGSGGGPALVPRRKVALASSVVAPDVGAGALSAHEPPSAADTHVGFKRKFESTAAEAAADDNDEGAAAQPPPAKEARQAFSE